MLRRGHEGHARTKLVAAVAGILGALIAIIVPFLPVQHTETTISWPTDNSLNPVTVPLVGFFPRTVDITIPCSAVAMLREKAPNGAVLLSTAPAQAGEEARARGLFVTTTASSLEFRSRNELLYRGDLDALIGVDGCEAITFLATAEASSVTVSGMQSQPGTPVSEQRLDSDIRPQVVGIFTDLSGPAPDGLQVDIEVDSRFTSQPTVLKTAAIVVGAILVLVSLIALHRLDLADGRSNRRFLPPEWWRPRLPDFVVLATLALWHFVGANTSDDGYILTEARAAVSSGYMTEFFRYYGAPYAPFGMPYYIYTPMAEISVASWWLRLPTLLLAIVTWWLISREVIPRLGTFARRNAAATWTAAAMFLAFWLTYNNGLRPEPIVAAGVIGTWVCLERSIATARLLPAAVGFLVGAFALSAAPTGTFTIAAIIAAARPLTMLIVRRVRRDGLAATVGPLIAAGTAVLMWIFVDSPLRTTLESSSLLGAVGPTGRWFEESWRYEWLLNATPDGSLSRRFAVAAMFLCLITCAAVIYRHHRIPGVAGGPARRLVGLSALSLAFMMFNPTKWTHHFGAFASIGAALGALFALAILPAALRSLRNRMLVLAALLFVLALSFESTNGWWYISIYGIPWGGTAPEIGGFVLANVFLIGCLAALLFALYLHLRSPFIGSAANETRAERSRRTGVVESITSAPLAIGAGGVVLILVASMIAGVWNQYPAYSVGLQNLEALRGRPCAMADAVLAEPDANAGLLSPVGAAASSLAADGTEGFDPNGIPSDLTATQKIDADVVGTGTDSDETSSSAGTGGGTMVREGINGSSAQLPFDLDPLRVPVLGSYQNGASQQSARLISDWFVLPESERERELLTVAVAGRFSPEAVQIEFGAGVGEGVSTFSPMGSVQPIDIGPEPSWRNLRVPMDQIPDTAGAVRILARDDNPDPAFWIAVTPPRVPVTQTVQNLVGSETAVLPDWAVAFHFPCQRPFNEYAGIVELPEYRILPDRGLAVSSTNTWQGADGGGPLGITELLLHGETVPTYLRHDWDRDWGSLVRYTHVVPQAKPAQPQYDEVVHSGLWSGGPLAK